jgi:fucose permease
MIKVRSASSFSSRISATGFWGGMTIGRVILGFVTERFGEKVSVIAYLLISIGLEIMFWLIPSFLVSAIAVAFLGFFLGPIFLTAVVMATKLLPKRLHVGAMGFATAFGGTGGAIFPFAVGAFAQAKGVRVLPSIILALISAISTMWLLVPRVQKIDRARV